MTLINSVLGGTATIGGYIAFGLLVYAAISVILGLFFGFSRGFSKTLLRLITIVAAAVVSFLAVIWIAEFVDEFFRGKTLEELLAVVWPNFEAEADPALKDFINAFDPETVERIVMAILSLIAIPIIFVLVFYIVKFLTLIVYGIFAGILGLMSKEKGFFSTIFGGILGAVQGLLIAAVVLLPTAGFLGVAEDMRADLTSADKPEESVVIVEEFYETYLDELIASEPVMILRQFGGDMIFEKMTSVKVADEEVDMREEAKSIAEILVDSLPLVDEDLNWKHLEPHHQNALRAILADVDANPYNASIIAGMLRGVCSAIGSESIPLELEEPFNQFAIQLVNVFANTDKTIVAEDLTTLLEIYFILGDADVLAAFDSESGSELDPKDLLIEKDEEGNTVIDNVITELNTNPRTVPIVTSLTKFSLQLMLDAFPATEALPEDVDIEVVYDNVKTGVNELLTEVNNPDATPEEKTESVASSLDETLKENNIALEEEVVNNIAAEIVKNFEGKEELTDEDINNALLAFYGAYADSIASGEMPPIEGIEGI